MSKKRSIRDFLGPPTFMLLTKLFNPSYHLLSFATPTCSRHLLFSHSTLVRFLEFWILLNGKNLQLLQIIRKLLFLFGFFLWHSFTPRTSLKLRIIVLKILVFLLLVISLSHKTRINCFIHVLVWHILFLFLRRSLPTST